MEKIVEFGISEASTLERLSFINDFVDLENGSGRYLGIIRVDNRYIMITHTNESGKVMANEVEYDIYPCGVVNVYYKIEKDKELLHLQKILNDSKLKKLLLKSKNIKETLFSMGIDVESGKTDFEQKIEDSFLSWERSEGNRKVLIKKLIVCGIKKEIFDRLKYIKENYNDISLYRLASQNIELQEKEQQRNLG